MRYLAFDVGGTGIKYAVMDADYRMAEKGSFATSGVTTSPEFVEALGRIHDRFAGDVAGIAISTCGELDPATGHMVSGGSLQFNTGTNLIDLVQARCATRVTVENDANCALLAELHDGALAGRTNGLVLTVGTGLGGALLLNGEIYHGTHFHAGNASFTLASLNEEYSFGGIIGFSTGVAALTAAVAAAKGMDGANLDGRAVFDLVEGGDGDALHALDAFCARLARFIYNSQVMLDVEVVALGGGISSRPAFVQTVARKVDDVFDAAAAAFIALPRPQVLACRHFNDANLVGALYHHRH